MELMIKTFKATNHPLTYRPFVKMWDFFLFIFFFHKRAAKLWFTALVHIRVTRQTFIQQSLKCRLWATFDSMF